MTDFSKWKAHASSVGYLMTNPQGKSNKEKYTDLVAEFDTLCIDLINAKALGKDRLKIYASKEAKRDKLQLLINELSKVKDEVQLSETAKKYLVRCFVKAKYGRTDDIETSAMLKGTNMEQQGITLLSRNERKMHKKNAETWENDYIIGTPDIVSVGDHFVITDVKCSWDLFTHSNHLLGDMEGIYYWQLQSYMWLPEFIYGARADKGRIARVLLDTPEFLLNKEIRIMQSKIPESEWHEAETQIRHNGTFPDLSIREKLIIRECNRNDEDIERIAERVKAGRKFLQQLDTMSAWNMINTELR